MNDEKRTLTLGSLFDGSGGFPLAGILSGIEPVWASEVEPFAIRVTTKRLPQMKHYVCDKVGERGKTLSEENLKRYMQHGYTVRCAYYQGTRYKNVYTFGGGIQCVL